MFHKPILALALAVGVALPLAGGAEAGVADSAAGATAVPVQSSPVTQIAYVWNGHNYCWYGEGWRGPGWYWCGYPAHYGLGWG